ncbi:MAG TPA: TMEM43 family protein [Methylocystis sp.]|nr:TMEM43 family protein [Methylocystis sp.]
MIDDDGFEQDSFTETTEVGWFSRLSSSLGGLLLGLALSGICLFGFVWNEGRAVTTARALAEGSGLVSEAAAGRLDPVNEGRLVHVSGELKTSEPLADPALSVVVTAARLEREVETYQWKETRVTQSATHLGGSQTQTTTYSYERVWARGRINSEHFHDASGHANPQPRFHDAEFAAKAPQLGAFRPGPATLRALALDDFPLAPESADALRVRYGDGVRAEDGRLYFGDPAAPRIGDARISYKILPDGAVSLVGRQTGADVTPYMTAAGKPVLLAERGAVPAQDMFREAEQQNAILTWGLRGALMLFLWGGLYLLLRPLVVLADVVPLLGELVAAGAGVIAGMAALVVGTGAIAFAWLAYRPAVSALLVIAGLALAWLLRSVARARIRA